MNSQELQLVNYEQAKRLKELGFDWNVSNYYNAKYEIEKVLECVNFNDNFYSETRRFERFSAPTVALALKWFRDVKEVFNGVCYSPFMDGKRRYNGIFTNEDRETTSFDTYESAESALLDELLTILEKEK